MSQKRDSAIFLRSFVEKHKTLIQTLVLTGLILLNCTGCATSYLWKASDLAGYNEPLPTNRLALFEASQKNDVLALYDECPIGRGASRRRAYFVLENARRTESAKRPRFVGLTNSNGLVQIPLCGTAGAATNIGPVVGFHAIQEKNPNRFTILAGTGESLGTFDLPTYHVPYGTAKCLAITPVTVAIDASIVGSVVFGCVVYMVAKSESAWTFTK